MKFLTLLGGLAMLCSMAPWPTFAQKLVEESTALTADKKVVLNLKHATSITIHTWSQRKAQVKGSISYSDDLEDLWDYTVVDDRNAWTLATEMDWEGLKEHMKAKGCENFFGTYTAGDNVGRVEKDCMVEKEIHYDVYVPEGACLIVETISGNISAEGLTGPVTLKSISGWVDFTWTGKGTSFSMHSVSGEVYTNLPVNRKGHDPFPMVGYEVTTEVNGGGKWVALETISNNVYLRKK